MGQFKTLFLGVFCSWARRQPIDNLTDDGRRFLEFESDLKPTQSTRMEMTNDRVNSNGSSFQVDICRVDRLQNRTDVGFDQEPVLARVDNRAGMWEFENPPQGTENIVSRVSSAVRSQDLDLPGRLKSPSRAILLPDTIFVGR